MLAGVGIQVSNANRARDLRGPFAFAGLGAGEGLGGGITGFMGMSKCGGAISGATLSAGLTFNFPTSAEYHAGVSDTGITMIG